jgi:hypothetical protein
MCLSKRGISKIAHAAVAALCVAAVASSYAGPREQAKRLHDRLAGTPPTAAELDALQAKVAAGDALGAALQAMTDPEFYNTTVRELATPWTNRDRSVYADLNDSTATVIGMVRDDVPFDQVLYEDIVYVGTSAATSVEYAQADNAHYVDLQTKRVDLSKPANLVRATQSGLAGSVIGAPDTAGIMTTRGFAQAFLVAGTNRAAVRFAALDMLCMDMENFRDVSAWPDRIRQDVSRSPGGDSSLFLNDCIGCHAGLDGLAGAFAYYDFDATAGKMNYTLNVVQPKFLKAAGTFPFGYQTLGDSWINYWRTGPNAFVGWNGPGSGSGAKSLGMELAHTRQFSECQVKKVFEKVCFREPNGAADLQQVQTIANSFEANNRSLKRVFAETAVYCMGQ